MHKTYLAQLKEKQKQRDQTKTPNIQQQDYKQNKTRAS